MKTKSAGDIIFYFFNTLFLLFIITITLYPFIYLVAVSFSDSDAILTNKVTLYPVGFTLSAYKKVFNNPNLWNSYKNTIIYTVSGTAMNLFFTTLLAYPLSKKRLMGRAGFIFFFILTLIISGGLIPSYLLIRNLRLYNTIWALILPGAVSVYYGMILRVYFEQIPIELEEAAMIDGMGTLGILLKIYIPLSIPIYASLVLFFAVGHWNMFFSALIYLKEKKSYPLQLILREIVVSGIMTDGSDFFGTPMTEMVVGEAIKAATIIVVVLPILCIYPFIQKYFVKGMMIGSLKG